MTPDMWTILTIIGTGVALALVIVPGQRELRRDVADLRERMSRLEGLFEGFTARRQSTMDNM